MGPGSRGATRSRRCFGSSPAVASRPPPSPDSPGPPRAATAGSPSTGPGSRAGCRRAPNGVPAGASVSVRNPRCPRRAAARITAMATVQGVNGPIDADELGLTLIHEHFFSSDEAVTAQWPHARDHETEHRLAIESAEAVMGHGVRTVVEPTAMLLGRDLPASIQARDRDRPADRRLHRRLHLRLPAPLPAEPQRGLHRRPLRPRHRAGDPGNRGEGGLRQVRRR